VYKVTVQPDNGCAFDVWTNEAGTAVDPFVSSTVKVDTTTTYTATFAADTLRDPSKEPDDSKTGDGIPDKYQAAVTYQVVNGTWADGSSADKVYVFTLKEYKGGNGVWTDVTPAPTLGSTVPTGMTADADHAQESGAWQETTPEADTVATDGASYTYKFTVSTALDVSAEGYEGPYDAKAHTVTPVATVDGATVTVTYTTQDGTVVVEPVDAGEYTATITAELDGYKTVTTTVTVKITPATLTVTTPDASKTYDGTALTAEGSISGLAEGETVTLTTTGTQTEVGSSSNTYTLDWGTVNQNNYTVQETLGTLTVTAQTNNRPSISVPVVPTTPPTTDIVDEDVPLTGTVDLLDEHIAFIQGYSDGSVRPGNSITREEVATIFYRLLSDVSHALYDTEENDFADVSDTRWSNKAISTLANAGILTGYPDGTFQPAQTITRAEFAAIAARFDVVTETVENPFTDTADHWAEQLISFAASKGWVNGYPDGTFQPEQAITRAEAMTLINRVLDREVDEEGLLAEAKQWSDNEKGQWYYYAVLEATNSHDYERRVENEVLENWIALTQDKTWDE
jgi:hypothetical protein